MRKISPVGRVVNRKSRAILARCALVPSVTAFAHKENLFLTTWAHGFPILCVMRGKTFANVVSDQNKPVTLKSGAQAWKIEP
jgi:hypothetical protein